MLEAIHDLFWNPLVCWIIDETGLCERSIEGDWTSVELYNRYEFFYETLIVGILTYLVKVVPGAILRDRAMLFRLADNNEGKIKCYWYNSIE